MKSVLFFTPYAGRTGSEMFLWYILSNFDRRKLKTSVISECDGPLLRQMPPDVQVYTTLKYKNNVARVISAAYRVIGKSWYDRDILYRHRMLRPDYWYLNTVLMTDKVPLARRLGVPVILHFHELTGDYGLVSKAQLQEAIDYATICIADSMAVYRKLQMLGARKVVLQYECIDVAKIVSDPDSVNRIKDELRLNNYDFVWMMSGSSSFRKGIDIIPELAAHLHSQNAALLWIGNNSVSGMDLMIEKELAACGLNNVFFLGKKVSDYYNYMDVMDGFVLTSREEPFGMVVTEALALGKPVVSFDSGGVREILTSDTGIIVESWNVGDLANAMHRVAKNVFSFNKQAAIRRAKDFDVSVQIRNWEGILDGL